MHLQTENRNRVPNPNPNGVREARSAITTPSVPKRNEQLNIDNPVTHTRRERPFRSPPSLRETPSLNGGKLQVHTPSPFKTWHPVRARVGSLSFRPILGRQLRRVPLIPSRLGPIHKQLGDLSDYSFSSLEKKKLEHKHPSFLFTMHRRTIAMDRTRVAERLRPVAGSHTIRRTLTPLARFYYTPPHFRMVGTGCLEGQRIPRASTALVPSSAN